MKHKGTCVIIAELEPTQRAAYDALLCVAALKQGGARGEAAFRCSHLCCTAAAVPLLWWRLWW